MRNIILASARLPGKHRLTAWFHASRPVVVALSLFGVFLGYGQLVPWLDHQRALAETSAAIAAKGIVLAHYKHVTDVTNTALRVGLDADPSLARLRVAFMHAPATNENLPLLRWDIVNALTRSGHVTGQLRSDLQVSDWTDYFGAMLAHQCANVDVAAIGSEPTLARIGEMQIRGFVVCPIVTPASELIGAVFGSWDVGDPDPPDLAATEAVVRAVADKIAAAAAGG